MAIIFNKEKQQFYLHTLNTSYIIELLNEKIPLHLYWGSRLEDMPPIAKQGYVLPGNLSVCDVEGEDSFVSSYGLPFEFPCYGTGDIREPSFHAIYDDGSRISRFEYQSHVIMEGKPRLEGLSATYGEENEVFTLWLNLIDHLTGLSICLQYSVFEQQDVITR